jgi:predicted Zn-dependent protease
MNAQQHFETLAAALCGGLAGGEELFLRLSGEDTDFVRFSQARIRQAGFVAQRSLGLTLVQGLRQAEASLDLGGDAAEDLRRAREVLGGLRAQLPLLPEDPWLNWQRSATRHERIDADRLPSANTTLAAILDAAAGLDLVGMFASGAVHAGFASSHGQRAWHSVSICSCDWSCHTSDGQAMKGLRAGTTWDAAAWDADMARARADLGRFATPRRRLEPGSYRAFLAPAALNDVVGLLGWGGFSLRSRRTRTSPLLRLDSGEARLSPLLSLSEDADGLAPLVTDHGFIRPQRVPLVTAGASGEALVSARSAKEYGQLVNAEYEAPTSLVMAPGTLPTADALRALGTGLWLGNLHYLNFSDRSAGRITGMTRFACWWVEAGEVVAPIEHLRFDDTVFSLLGEQLEALTCERELIPDTGTYGSRSLASCELPGAVVAQMRFTL